MTIRTIIKPTLATRFSMLPLFSLLLMGCANVAHKSNKQNPEALIVPKKWVLQSYTYDGKTKVTKGHGIWISLKEHGTYISFDGKNSTYSGPPMMNSGYTATTDGDFHFQLGKNSITTAVYVTNPYLAKEISKRNELLLRVNTFTCSENNLILSDGSPHNQLIYIGKPR